MSEGNQLCVGLPQAAGQRQVKGDELQPLLKTPAMWPF